MQQQNLRASGGAAGPVLLDLATGIPAGWRDSEGRLPSNARAWQTLAAAHVAEFQEALSGEAL